MTEFSDKEPRVMYIEPKMYGIDLERDDPVGVVGESRAYRGDDRGKVVILKVFAFGLPDYFVTKVSLKQLLRYREIIEVVREVTPQITTPFDTKAARFTFGTVPIDLVGMVDYGNKEVPASVSRFIEGPRLDEDEKIRDLLDAIAMKKGIKTSKTQDPIFLMLGSVTEQLRRLTNERAIRLERINLKFQETNYGYHLTITDPCAEVSKITV